MRRGPGTPIDLTLGQNLRSLRASKGLPLRDLAKLLDVTFQQIHKYESGQNRISVPLLIEICQTLDVPIAVLLEGIEGIRLV